jgi:hypothetical protein
MGNETYCLINLHRNASCDLYRLRIYISFSIELSGSSRTYSTGFTLLEQIENNFTIVF